MEFSGTLDEKFRISLPARIRGSLKENKIILTKGDTKSIWVFAPEDYVKFTKKLFMDHSNLSSNKRYDLQRRFIAPKAEMEIDKAGRIILPLSLRNHACLSREITILELILEGVIEGEVDRLEIWDSGNYAEYEKESEEQVNKALDQMWSAPQFSGNPG
ncbi:MAG: cell division/cell wall cluster transcriptional repressor MraZ [Treponema sp.]|jgi:MraZ protein|nr:cell division/cell wall cluster transcriptional repressor MraZ [Treponema sp.]